MSLELRPFQPEETAAFDRVLSIVFGNYGQRRAEEPLPDTIRPEWSLCAFEDGEMATTYAAYPMVQRLNGGKSPAAGVTAVGTLPHFRRRGHLRKIMETDLRRRYEQRMEPLAILLASIAGIYQRYGYAVTTTSVRFTIDPRWIRFTPSLAPATGTWREGSRDEAPLLDRMYREFSSKRNGYLHRAPVMWDTQTFGTAPNPGDPQNAGPSVISIYEEDGQPAGFVAWTARWMPSFHGDHFGPGQRIFVRDFVWLTPGAHRAMWEFFSRFDLAAAIHVDAAPTDDPAFYTLLDPRELNATHRDAILARIIDLERLLPLRPYGSEGRIVFEVRDEMCPWNAGRWALDASTGAGQSAVSRTKDAPELTMDIATLAQLLYGQISPSNAVRYGRADAAASTRLRTWDAIWRTEYAPFCPNGF